MTATIQIGRQPSWKQCESDGKLAIYEIFSRNGTSHFLIARAPGPEFSRDFRPASVIKAFSNHAEALNKLFHWTTEPRSPKLLNELKLKKRRRPKPDRAQLSLNL